MILHQDGSITVARDNYGRLPIIIGKNEEGYAISFESFAFEKLGYEFEKECGPHEIVKVSVQSLEILSPSSKKMKFCSFLWSYYGYPTATYEGINVEAMRVKNGELLAQNESDKRLFNHLDYVCGVPDSGTPHAIGYASQSQVKFARCFIKYTPSWARSFMPHQQTSRNTIAKMKQIPVKDFIQDKKILFVDDSIVRGTQIKETVDFLKEQGAKEVHMRSACPPIMFACQYLNFSPSRDDMELITRKIIFELEGEKGFEFIDEYCDKNSERGKQLRQQLAQKFGFASVDFQTLDGIIEAIGLSKECLCTYCWNGEE